MRSTVRMGQDGSFGRARRVNRNRTQTEPKTSTRSASLVAFSTRLLQLHMSQYECDVPEISMNGYPELHERQAKCWLL